MVRRCHQGALPSHSLQREPELGLLLAGGGVPHSGAWLSQQFALPTAASYPCAVVVLQAICRHNSAAKTGAHHFREAEKVSRKKAQDLRCALADCDHALRFFDEDPQQKRSSAQAWIVWQLRGRIRAAMGSGDFQSDFSTAQELDPSCAMTYLLCGRCLWRKKMWDQAVVKYKEGLSHPHNKDVKFEMEKELQELEKQMKEWKQWEAEEAERCSCTVM